MIRALLLVLAGLLVACGGGADAPADTAGRADVARTVQGITPEEAGRERSETLLAPLVGVWAVPGGCGEAAREWRIEPRGFHAAHLNCDLLFTEQAEGGVRAVADCLVDGFSDGAEDSFLFLTTTTGGLSILDETVGGRVGGLERCAAGGEP